MRVGVRRAGLRVGLLGLLVTSAVSLVFVGSAAAAGSVSFASAVDYGDGIIPGSVAVADLNGDGRPDLAAANGFAAVSVLLGNGDGTFQAKVDYETGTFPQSVAVADLNGDGKPDLAVASLGVDAVSVLLGNGDGTFQPKVDYGTGHFPRSVAVADLNGDGKPDLAVANSQGSGSFSGTVSVLLGNGDGTFQPKVDYDTGDGPYSVAAADLNGDGKPDLAVANNDQNTVGTVSVLVGNGDGTFQAKVDYDTGTPVCGDKFCTNSQPASVAVADLNGDGKPDLAIANNGVSTVSVLLGNGDGTFQAHADYATGTFPVSVAVVDLNGDGKPDLAVANNNPSGTVSVLLGNGDGTFQTKADFGTGRPVSVAAVDLNGDGKPDLAYGNVLDPAAGTGAVSVLLNTTTSPDTVAPTVSLSADHAVGPSGWFNAAILGPGRSLGLTASADDAGGSGVASIDCTVDNGLVQSSATSPFDYASPNDGTHNVSCTATDNAGNLSAAVTATYRVDATPPEIGSSIGGGVLGSNGWYTRSPTFTLIPSDATSRIATTKYQIDSGTIQTYSGPFTFADGAHTIAYWSVDNAGNESTHVRSTIKIDTVAPILVVSGNMVVNATSPAGAKVSYLASVGDNSGGSGVASSSCIPASGSLFPIGTTTVHCTASDNAGNTSTGSFTVHVSSASEQLSLLLAAVNGVSPGSALASKLTQVQGYIAKNDKADACSGLSSFLGLVASQKGKKLTDAQANSFTTQASSIRLTLGC